jgi:thiamine pyrophosphate-dependent acetolactate synthase large subunit-like protein
MRMSMGQRIVELLAQEGVSAVFSQGDITTRDVLLHAERAGMLTVGPRHEASAVFAAMGFYAVSGRPQAAFGAMGPGVANMLPAAVAASRENIPVIIFGARRHQGAAHAIRRGQWLSAPMEPLFAQICKFAVVVRHPAEIDDAVQEGFRHALSGTPGPVYIEYDSMMHIQEWDYPDLVAPSRYRAGPQFAPAASVRAAAQLLGEAAAPMLLAGEAVQHTRCQPLLIKLAEKLGCPVLTTFAGSGVIAASHPQAILFQSQAGQQAIAQSDLVLVVGTCFPENANYGRLGAFAADGGQRKVVSLDTDLVSIGGNCPVDLAVVGDLELSLQQLVDALPGRPLNSRLREWKERQAQELAAAVAAIPDRGELHPSRMMIEARQAVPDKTSIVLDGGLTIFYQHAFFEKRGADFVYGAHYSHLGCGLPQAVGVQLAQGREHPVCLITGDGALGFHFMELETAVRHRLPLVVLVNDDRALGAEVAAHMNHIGHPIEARFSDVRYDQMMIAMGGHGELVDRAEDVQPAIRRAFASGKTAVVQVRTDPHACHLEPHPFAAARASWIHADVEDRYGRAGLN